VEPSAFEERLEANSRRRRFSPALGVRSLFCPFMVLPSAVLGDATRTRANTSSMMCSHESHFVKGFSRSSLTIHSTRDETSAFMVMFLSVERLSPLIMGDRRSYH